MKGSYILILWLDQPLVGLQVGRLGRFDLHAGYYLYVGSAFGPGGLRARLAHHQRRAKARPHWHIDYLRMQAHLCEAWTVTSSTHLECVWCRALAAHPEVTLPIRGFGARDTGCAAHLFYLPRPVRSSLLTAVILNDVIHQPEPLQIEVHRFDATT
ncbi:GIY-YIG nuclease family protein [Candidatus Viridilinea mediisalina]|uniref:GIY-YIG nuclease family protein n=1 Tax=Candidatus Viridilinea mediisalina TaxID=2024553 RepID=UPI001FEB5684|nr:GIY-YIG nuclease family protein [Candidatus Viridilinea mediisalina]